MKTGYLLLIVLMVLLAACGCTDTRDPIGDGEVQNDATGRFPKNGSLTPASMDTGTTEIPVDLSQVEITGSMDFSPDVSSIILILLSDPRAGVLLENGWNITSVNERCDEGYRDRCCVDVEFRKDGLSFFIGVDELEGHTIEGYCNAEAWVAEPISGSLPEDYHKAKDKTEGRWHVFDHCNERVVMIYNETTIFYLYPSYAIIDMEGILN